jgi:tetratricopeptide (TPR) repeat protein
MANLGVLATSRRDYAAAEQQFRRALSIQADDAGVYCNLGVALRAQRRLEEAVSANAEAPFPIWRQPHLDVNSGAIYLAARHEFLRIATFFPNILMPLPKNDKAPYHCNASSGNERGAGNAGERPDGRFQLGF